jgi:hypothetical protein
MSQNVGEIIRSFRPAEGVSQNVPECPTSKRNLNPGPPARAGRPADKLSKYPPSATRVVKPSGVRPVTR